MEQKIGITFAIPVMLLMSDYEGIIRSIKALPLDYFGVFFITRNNL